MDKKFCVLFGMLLIVSMFAFVAAANEPSLMGGDGGEDVEEIEGLIGNYSPLDESGEIDFEKYKPFRTRAEERIDKINLWLEENASWLKVVLGMVPSITWLFIANMWVWLMAFLILVLNLDTSAVLFKFLGKKIDLLFFEPSLATLLGIILFVLLLTQKVYYNIGIGIVKFFDVVWNYVLPGGIVLAVVAIIVLIVLLFVAPAFVGKWAKVIGKVWGKRKARKLAERQEEAVEAVEKIVEGATEK